MMRESMILISNELKQAWRESGACASYCEPLSAGTRKCAACGKPELAHRLLRWATRIETEIQR